jgi:hypothetical protein
MVYRISASYLPFFPHNLLKTEVRICLMEITMSKTLDRLYREREKRIDDAVKLKKPDRVPVMVEFSYFPATYTGLTFEAAWYDYDGWLKACLKSVQDYEPDLVHVTPFFPGEILEHLDPKSLRWPGHGVTPNSSHQYLELENMEGDEYDLLLRDPTDYMLRFHLPRVCGAMEGFQMLPRLADAGYSYRGALVLAQALAKPEVAAAVERLQRIGLKLEAWRSRMDSFSGEIDKLGFPQFNPGTAQAPFDTVSDFLRGMQGTMLDMFRQPDKLREACDWILHGLLERGMPAVNVKSICPPLLFMGFHRGSDGFMSLRQFETFYWPTLKKVILAVINAGLTPCLFCEGDWTTRLKYLLELPAAKSVARLDLTDIFKAKQVLKGHTCIMGNVPASLLQTGTPRAVKAYCKKLVDVAGKEGGFIMSAGSSIDNARPENLKAMVDFTKEYGEYR